MIRYLEIALAGIVYGGFSALMVRHFTDAPRMNRSFDLILARVLEFRLFIDEPRVIFRAQRALLAENARVLRQIALPCALPAILFIALYPAMDREFGHRLMRAGESAVVTSPLTETDSVLKAPAEIVVETPGVRAMESRQISWRVRAVKDVRYPEAAWLGWFFVASFAGALVLVTLHGYKMWL